MRIDLLMPTDLGNQLLKNFTNPNSSCCVLFTYPKDSYDDVVHEVEANYTIEHDPSINDAIRLSITVSDDVATAYEGFFVELFEKIESHKRLRLGSGAFFEQGRFLRFHERAATQTPFDYEINQASNQRCVKFLTAESVQTNVGMTPRLQQSMQMAELMTPCR